MLTRAVSSVLGAAALGFALLAPVAASADTGVYDTSVGIANLSGSRTLSVSEFELDAGGNGISSPTFQSLTLAWDISVVNAGVTPWHYKYTVSWLPANSLAAISHMILDLSDNCSSTSNCVANAKLNNVAIGSGDLLYGTYSAGGSNPFMAGVIKGIKFDIGSGSPYTLEFDSERAPVWGDFYTKGGQASTSTTGWYAQNLGAGNTTSSAIMDYIARPDTVGTLQCANGATNPPLCNNQVETPEPLSLALLGTGLAGLGFIRRRKAA